MTVAPRPRSVLFLCTGNSARSQIAEAIMNERAHGRFKAESAGSRPAARVNPFAVGALHDIGIDWSGHAPRGTEGLEQQPWDYVITVCDNAKESCPILPGHPIHAHWGMEDPAEVEGTDEEKRRAFRTARVLIQRRIDLMLALPLEKLDRMNAERRLGAIATETAATAGAGTPAPASTGPRRA